MLKQRYNVLFYGLLSLNVAYFAYKSFFSGSSPDDLDSLTLEIPYELGPTTADIMSVSVTTENLNLDWGSTRHALLELRIPLPDTGEVKVHPYPRHEITEFMKEYTRCMRSTMKYTDTPQEFVGQQQRCIREILERYDASVRTETFNYFVNIGDQARRLASFRF